MLTNQAVRIYSTNTRTALSNGQGFVCLYSYQAHSGLQGSFLA